MRVLTVNAGSSSLKLGVLDEHDELVAERSVDHWHGQEEPLREFLAEVGRVDLFGHRLVHGGNRVTGPAIVDDELLEYLDSLTELAPLHQQRALEGVRVTRQLAPGSPTVVCVDTAFHATLPRAAATYALPREWNERWGLRRFGFHGLSHSHAVSRAAELLRLDVSRARMLVCHLGAGASLAAVSGGRSVDTTMGFTPDEGLVMNTRSGSVDPGLLGWLQQHRGVDGGELYEALHGSSGIAGLSGTSGDLREVRAAGAAGDEDARLALEVYQHSLVRHAGAMIAVLGGLDALVFTGGIGEHQPKVRAHLAGALEFLGVAVDDQRNHETAADSEISADWASVGTAVVSAREDLEIARQARNAAS